jgi:GTP-binding protein LepA
MNMIRNFAIIAHIDHGKSTLADRFLELTNVVEAGSHDNQMLDRNPISRERGITIKLAPVRMRHMVDGQEYVLNLIDTPGHVDFSYEVDRTLACVEGVILLVDATQGIQAQTIANAYKALEKNLVIIPVVNKIDLPNAEVEKTKRQLVDFLGVHYDEIFEISAKSGLNVPALLKTVTQKIPSPPPQSSPEKTQVLIFDSYYDSHRGVIAFIRVFSGELRKGMKVKLASNNLPMLVDEVGIFLPDLQASPTLESGQIGYVVTNLKDIHLVRVGDTVVDEKGTTPPLSGYKKINPMVYASMFTTDTGDYPNLKKALEKLYLNDSSLEFTPIYSQALGAGFRVGFLGLLHADVIRERLEREYNLDLVLTPPQVEYKYENNQFFEPIVKILMITPDQYVGNVMQLCENYRARFITMDNKNQTSIHYEMPLSEMVSDFFDNLKSVSSGYASLDWEFLRHEPVKADKLEVLLNDELVDEFSEVVVAERAEEKGRSLTARLKEIIPKQQFEVKIQARYKGKILASERVTPFRKNVLMKGSKMVGGGDFSRKRKLLEKQKEGKKRMKMVGKVEIPKESFLKLFRKDQ